MGTPSVRPATRDPRRILKNFVDRPFEGRFTRARWARPTRPPPTDHRSRDRHEGATMVAPRGWCLPALLIASTAALAQGPGRQESDDARAVAKRVDAMLAEKWASAHVVPVAVADDAELLRRAYLDLIGTIPTAAEASDFLDDPAQDKRA